MMHRFVSYSLLFGVLTALQIFLFDNLQLTLYIHPFAYLAFVILLPMRTPGYLLLVLAALMGAVMDFFSGTPGVHTIATTAAAFCRPALLRLLVGKEIIGDGGIPNAGRIGRGKFFRYSFVFILIHAVVFFIFETLSTVGLLFTAMRTGLSIVCSILVIWVIQRVYGHGSR